MSGTLEQMIRDADLIQNQRVVIYCCEARIDHIYRINETR